MEPGTIGGLLLILGAYALYKGNLLWSVGLYFFADTMWVWLAYKQEDYFGTFAISLGMLFGLLVWIKSHKGDFVKDLHAKKEEPIIGGMTATEFNEQAIQQFIKNQEEKDGMVRETQKEDIQKNT